jgi:hypothetical protein
MTTDNAPTPRKQTLLVVAVVAIVVAVAAVGLSIYLVARGGGDASPTPTPTSDVEMPAPSGTGVDACLGGADLTADAVYTAQQEAANTPEGAVSYAAAFARYILQIPAPADASELASWTGLSSEWWSRWAESAESWTGPTPLSVTTTNGGYQVQSYSPDEAVVTVELPWVVDGAISPNRTFVPTITMGRAVSGDWTITEVESSGGADSGSILTDRVDFVGGC